MSTAAARYPQIVRAVAESPWAMRPDRLAVVLEIVAMRASGERLSAEEIEARVGAAPARRQTVTEGAVAVLPLYGVMVPRANLMSQMSGGTSVSEFAAAFEQAVADPGVDAILMDIDSPGGMTDLVPELAAQIRGARGQKPIVAIANTDAASAAYWIASQADELVVTPSGLVGSIGVYAAHEDISAQQEMEGVSTTLISAGKFKVENSPFAPLSEEARAAIQGRVDAFYVMFVADVAAGRGVTEAAVRDGFGQGRVVTAKDALAAGMVDRVGTFDETLRGLIRGKAARSSRANAIAAATADDPPGDILLSFIQAAESGLSFADEAEAVVAVARRLQERTASLAEVERGGLTAVKRERLSACTGALRGTVSALEELLAATDPHRHAEALMREAARMELRRSREGAQA